MHLHQQDLGQVQRTVPGCSISSQEWNQSEIFFSWVLHKVPGPWAPDCEGGLEENLTAARPTWGSACQNRRFNDSGTLPLSRPFSTLSLWSAKEYLTGVGGALPARPPLLSSNPQSIARLELRPLLSSDVWSCPVTNYQPLPRLHRQSMSSFGLLTAAAVLTLPTVAVEILLVFLSILCAETMKKIQLGE